jgi:hypothetical protein
VLVERPFDFDRGNVFAAADNDVLLAVAQLDVAVWIYHTQISGTLWGMLEHVMQREPLLWQARGPGFESPMLHRELN